MLVYSTRGSDYMSNQKNKLLLDFLRDYTSGKIDFNYNEIKAGMRFYEMSIGHNLSEETFYETTDDEFIPKQISLPEKAQLDMSELLCELLGEVGADNVQEETATVVKKTVSGVWKQNFIKDVKDYLYPELLNRKSMTQENVIKIFERKFLKQVPDCDKIKTETTRPVYYSKVHKLIYNNWIKAGLVEFHNGIYTVVKINQA